MACWIGSGFCYGRGPWQIVDVGGEAQLVHVGDAGRGINRQLVHVGDAEALRGYFADLADRLRKVRVCCGDWSRIMGESPTIRHGVTAVFLDPPYADTAARDEELYRVDCNQVAHAVREWAIEHGSDKRYRIALCGYDGEHVMPDSWAVSDGKARMGHGFGGQSKDGYANAGRERIWYSPHCVKVARQAELFAEAGS